MTPAEELLVAVKKYLATLPAEETVSHVHSLTGIADKEKVTLELMAANKKKVTVEEG